MKNLRTFEEFLNESKSMPAHIEKAAKELAYSMPNHSIPDDGDFYTDDKILKAIKKYNPALQQALKHGLEKEILDLIQKTTRG